MKISKQDPLHEQLARHQKNTSGCAHDMKKWKFYRYESISTITSLGCADTRMHRSFFPFQTRGFSH